ncbi:two component transcriptional regulator, LytTR family [Kriegella aquimaris]|uniref:Two component transcriptional regulator, LytTR family n=2 Tax=Kriegella aquimaris TaxID=192904 RepID=A0A1G9NTK2_9FLAO|nr:two component transcriptional regulator, LytTR family [Kriegella aquimaris]
MRILIVEDDMIIAANLSLQLTSLGYEVTGIESRGEEAITHAIKNTPDILLLDINLKGKIDGIETAKEIQKHQDIPIIYLTANSDEATFEKAKSTHPKAFIAKPFNRLNLHRTIALVVEQLKNGKEVNSNPQEMEILEDRIFIRQHGNMVKLLLKDIQYIEADRNYCTIMTDSGSYVLATTLKVMEEKLSKSHFLRVHRSFMVNLSQLDAVAEHHLEIGRKVIPLSKSNKDLLLDRIRTI